MNFNFSDFNSMREWLENLPARYKETKEARLYLFDKWRYKEEYETIYNFIEMMGGKIIYDPE